VEAQAGGGPATHGDAGAGHVGAGADVECGPAYGHQRVRGTPAQGSGIGSSLGSGNICTCVACG